MLTGPEFSALLRRYRALAAAAEAAHAGASAEARWGCEVFAHLPRAEAEVISARCSAAAAEEDALGHQLRAEAAPLWRAIVAEVGGTATALELVAP